MEQLFIQNNAPVCQDFWGHSAVFHAYAEMPDEQNRNYNAALAELEAKRAAEMGIKIARSNFPCWAWDGEKYNWETPECQALYRWLERMQKYGITVALNPWCCPGEVTGTGWNKPYPWADPKSTENSITNFANYISEAVHQIVEVRGFHCFKILTLLTEPQRGVIPFDMPQKTEDGAYGIFEFYKKTAIAVDAALRRDGRRHLISIMGPNEGSTPTSPMLKWITAHVPEGVMDIFSSHNYQWYPEFLKDSEAGLTAGFYTIAPGGRIFTKILLQPHTEYEVRFRACVQCEDLLHLSGNVLVGAFAPGKMPSAGGQPTSRLNRHSVATLDSSEFQETFNNYSMCFSTENETEANLTIFNDLKAVPFRFYVSRLEVLERATGKQIFVSEDFCKDFKKFDLFAGHILSNDVAQDWQNWATTALKYVPKGKPFIFDEYNIGHNKDHSREEHGANLATAMVSLMNSGVTSTMIWTLFDQQWPNNHTNNADCFVDGEHRWGLAQNLNKTLVPHKSYYAFSLISRYTGGKNSLVFTGLGHDGLNATMNETVDGQKTVIVVNNNETAKEFTLTFEQPLQANLNRHRFNPATLVPDEKATHIGSDKVFENVSNVLNDSIAPYSVTVYTTITDK